MYKRQFALMMSVSLLFTATIGVMGYGQRASVGHGKRPVQKFAPAVVEEKKLELGDHRVLANASAKTHKSTDWLICIDRDLVPNGKVDTTSQRIANAISKSLFIPADRWTYYSAVNKPPVWVIKDWAGVLCKTQLLEDGGYLAIVRVNPVFATTPYGNTIGCPWDYLEEYYIGIDGKAVYRRSLDPQGTAGMEPGYVVIGG